MLTLETAATGLRAGRLPERLRQISGCSYQILTERPHFSRNPQERTADNGMIGSNLSAFYTSKKAEYGTLPKSKEEAAILGVRNFDGLQVSVCDFNSLSQIELAPVRYSVLSAYQSCRKELLSREDYSGLAALEKENPLILGIGVYAVVRYEGKPHLMLQIKGNAIGSGQLHSGLVAGGVSIAEFSSSASPEDMLLSATKRQAKEEIGLSLEDKNLGGPSLLRLENSTGNIGFGYILNGFSGTDIIDAYGEHVRQRLIASSDDTAAGVALMPAEGVVMISLDGGTPALSTRKEIIVTQEGIKTVSPDSSRALRPAGQGYLAALSEPDFVQNLLEIAGI